MAVSGGFSAAGLRIFSAGWLPGDPKFKSSPSQVLRFSVFFDDSSFIGFTLAFENFLFSWKYLFSLLCTLLIWNLSHSPGGEVVMKVIEVWLVFSLTFSIFCTLQFAR